MENPLELPAPEDPIQRVHEFVRDLAYGAIEGIWLEQVEVWSDGSSYDMMSGDDYKRKSFKDYLDKKWRGNPPRPGFMISFDYFSLIRDASDFKAYLLTQRAFALLEKPFTPPSVFISYKQDQSSALALLIEARLRLADGNVNVFIDKLLQPGEDWEQRLEATIRKSRYLICLITADSLNSTMVKKELEWATDAGCILIAMCHNKYGIDGRYPAQLTGKQAIVIKNESAKDYESAISDLLNSMGYSTY